MVGLLNNERELLARMIQAEAGNQGDAGMLAVASVMDNRRRAQGYGGSTFRDVLLAPGQFSPANSITGYAGGEQGVDLNRIQPSPTAYSVADTVMGGEYQDPTGGALNFLNPDISQPSWLSSMQNTVKIGDHLFGTAGTGEGMAGRPGGSNMPRKAMGLLGTPTVSTQGQQPHEQMPRGGGAANLLDTLAVGLEGMTLNPNRALMQASQQRIQRRGEAREGAQKRNRTLEYLRGLGTPQAAEALRYAEATGDLGGALQMARATAKPVRGVEIGDRLVNPVSGEVIADFSDLQAQYTQVRGTDLGLTGEAAGRLYNVGPDGKVTQVGGSGTVINTGDQSPQVGTIPQGYQLVPDPETGPGRYRMEPIPGGPAAAELEQAIEAGVRGDEQTARAAGVVLEDIDALQKMLNKSLLPITGAIGALLRRVPGTDAYDASALIQTIAGNIGFDRLQQMRDASPTGGALGAISERELSTLQSVLGSLDQAQSQEQFERNLSRLEGIYGNIMRKAAGYPNAAEFGFDGAASQSGVPRIRYDAQGNRIK